MLKLETVASYVFAAILAGVLGALPLGPDFAVTVTEAAGRGFLHGLMVVVGHASVEAVMLVGLTLGRGAFLRSDPARAKGEMKKKINRFKTEIMIMETQCSRIQRRSANDNS